MILFFYGDDNYRSLQKKLELKSKYLAANSIEVDLVTLDATLTTENQLASALLTIPFLAKTRLLIIDDLLKSSKDLQNCFEQLIDKLPKTTVVLIYESQAPDKRSILFKKLITQTKSQEFPLLDQNQTSRWIKDFVTKLGVAIERDSLTMLAKTKAGDLWGLDRELTRLSTFMADHKEPVISVLLLKDITRMVVNNKVFDLTDSILSQQSNRAVAILNNLLSEGENPQYILAMLGSLIRTLILVKDALDQSHDSIIGIGNFTGLSNFVISKHLATAKRSTFNSLINLLEQLVQTDLVIKYGIMEASIALELFTLSGLENRSQDWLKESFAYH